MFRLPAESFSAPKLMEERLHAPNVDVKKKRDNMSK